MRYALLILNVLLHATAKHRFYAVAQSPVSSPTTLRQEQLRVACNFLALTDLSVCLATRLFNGNTAMPKIPTEIGLLTQLTYLDLADNQLTGTIPSTLGQLTQLTYLDLYKNQLNGTIPSTLGQVAQLALLDLFNNQLTGTIPSILGNLIQLTYLDFYSNQLNGTIPSTLGNLIQLTYMDLWNNQLIGTIPSTLGQLTQLTLFSLAANQLIGTIPSTLGQLTQLTSFNLGGNKLNGTIPSTLGQLTQLNFFFFGSNQLSGTIPTNIGLLTQLKRLDLDSNQLSGTIPTNIGFLTQLTILYLFFNRLTGTIPTNIGLLTQLNELVLQANQLIGTIPTNVGFLVQLNKLGLAYSQLSGTIPTNIGLLTQLKELDLSLNQLSGTVPTNIGLLTQLTFLSLNSNELLRGTIPSTLCSALNNIIIDCANIVCSCCKSNFTTKCASPIPAPQLPPSIVTPTRIAPFSAPLPVPVPVLPPVPVPAPVPVKVPVSVPVQPVPASVPVPIPVPVPVSVPVPVPVSRPIPTQIAPALVPLPIAKAPARIPTTVPPSRRIIDIYQGDVNFKVKVESVVSGDTIIFHEGDYSTDDTINISVDGAASSPVVIRGAFSEKRPRILRSSTGAVQSTINIEGSTFLTIQGLEIMSNGGDGIKIASGNGVRNNNFITLDNLVIHQVAVGINAQSNVDGILVVRNSTIFNTSGQGIYLGCRDGTCSVTNSVIEGNWINTTASDQGNGIELNKKSYGVIRNNVIHNTNSTGILVSGAAIIEGNVMWNCEEGGINVAADAIIRNNLVFSSGYGLISRVLHSVTPRNLTIVHNTFLRSCLSIRSWNDRSDIIFANNAVYCTAATTMDIPGGIQNVKIAGNVFFPNTNLFPPGSFVVGRNRSLEFETTFQLNAYPRRDSTLRTAANATYAANVLVDFDGTPRGNHLPADVGAYEWISLSGLKWNVSAGFKPLGDNVIIPVPEMTPTSTPTITPLVPPQSAPAPTKSLSPTKSPTKSRCGLFNLSIFCPLTFCGIFGRLIRLCKK